MKSIKVFNTLVAFIALNCATIANAQQGTTHEHPISDALTQKYLTEYMGITNYSGSNWGYTATRSGSGGWGGWGSGSGYTYTAKQPTAVAEGEAIFIEVNDYWKGTNWEDTPSLYNQVKYGIKSISKVTNTTSVGNGMLYHCDATTNRFFFAIRTSSIYTSYGEWTLFSGNNCYIRETNRMPFRWYNEFSAVTNTGASWDGLTASFDAMKDGDFIPAPHSCSNSIEKNHFTTLYDKETTDQTYTVSAMLFVPTGANASSNKKNGSFEGNNIPQQFFYVNKLAGERVDNASNNSKFAIDLNWETSFDKARKKGINITTWNSTNGGVKEESRIYRKIEGSDEFTEVYVANGLVDIKKWTDNTLPKPKSAEGYDVTYYVVTRAITYNRNGERMGEVIGSAVTNQVTFHIPGSEQYFELLLSNVYSSKFQPAAGNIHKSTNLVKNNISSKATNYSPTLSDLVVGDKFVLSRDEEGKGVSAINTLVITGVNNGTFSYTLNGKASSARWTSIQGLLDVVAKHSDELNVTPGRVYDAHYELVYYTQGAEYHSNVVDSRGKRTDVKVAKVYRSGTPDPSKNSIEELYTVDVQFKPVMSDDIAYYYVWRNATERIARIDHNGTSYTVVGKDINGNFNINLGNVEVNDEGFLSVQIDNAISKHVCEYEQGQGTKLGSNDLFFTVEVCTTGDNSYGNYDQESDFEGSADELVVNSYGLFYVGDATRPGQYCAEIAWDKIKNESNLNGDDYVSGEPDYYTVYRWWTSESGEVSYQPITKFFKGHNARYDSNGQLIEAGEYELVSETERGEPFKFTPELIEETLAETGQEQFYVIDFITDRTFVPTAAQTFPAMYYVKAHFINQFSPDGVVESWLKDENGRYALQNFVEKNSNPTRATSLIVTGVSETVVSEVVATTYYDIMGRTVVAPAQGEIVIARSLHADGSTTARVVKM